MPLTSLAKAVNMKQLPTPITVGTSAEIIVHLILCVSFFIVNIVVEQGQCIKENSIMLIAVIHVQPLSTNNCFNTDRLSSSSIFPFAIYAMMIIGITISFAGNPKIKARRITPSNPITLANGSKKSEQYARSVISPICTFAMTHMTSPAGAAIAIALPSTKSVRSNIE